MVVIGMPVGNYRGHVDGVPQNSTAKKRKTKKERKARDMTDIDDMRVTMVEDGDG